MRKLKDIEEVHKFLQGTGVLYITKDNCPACVAQSKIIENQKYRSGVYDIAEFEVSDNSAYPVTDFEIEHTPSFMFTHKGKTMGTVGGLLSGYSLTNLFVQTIYGKNFGFDGVSTSTDNGITDINLIPTLFDEVKNPVLTREELSNSFTTSRSLSDFYDWVLAKIN